MRQKQRYDTVTTPAAADYAAAAAFACYLRYDTPQSHYAAAALPLRR